MNLRRDELSHQKEATEDLFLDTVATRICEIKKYDPSDIGPIQSALSEAHSKVQKGVWGRHNDNELSLVAVLKQRIETLNTGEIERDEYSTDPVDTLRTVLQAIEDSVSTIKRTHTINPRSNIFELFGREGSATYGQELSALIGKAMRNTPRY
jgi:hypothetical protein